MIPILFDSNETEFSSNGLGRLDAISCVVSEELNGIFELEMSYPVGGQRFSDLVVSNIILAQPYDGADPQPFRIYKISKAMDGRVTVSARHLSYQLNWIPVMPFNYSSLSDCLEKLVSQSVYTNPFTFETEKVITTGGAFTEPLPCRSMLGGVQGSVLQRYGGDYEWDNWTVRLLARRGSDNGVRISYGKNLISAQQETNIESTYTGVCPYYIDNDTEEVTTLPEKYVLASTAGNFPFLRIQTVDFSSDFDEIPTVAQLRARAEQYITENNIGHPSVSIDVSFIALWQTEDYKDIAPLERVQLGDTVTVHFEKLGIDEQARVVAYDYDVLRERYNSVTIGDAKSSFAKTFVQQGHLIEETANSITDEVRKGTSWLTRGDGYVVAVKNTDGSWKELLFLDTPSIETAQKVLRINENGIGFSDNGVNGDYAQSWTLDGVLSLGGLNNAYGSLQLLDANAKITAEFSNQGIWLDEYNRAGQRTSSAYVYGDGIMVSASGSDESTDLAAGQVMVTDDDGNTTMITGEEVSTTNIGYLTVNGYTCYNGTFTFDDGTVFTIRRGVITNIQTGSGSNNYATKDELQQAIESLQEQIDDIDGGGSGGGGVSRTITIDPTSSTDLEFENGRLVDWDQSPY